MRKISLFITVLSAVAVASVASAQTPKGGGAGTAATPATPATPAKGAGGGTATPAKGAGGGTTSTMKPGDKMAPPTTTGGTAMPTKPTVPTQLTAQAKKIKGTWTCKGDMMGPDGNPAYKTTFTVKNKLDLDSMYIRTDMAEAKSKAAKYPFKFTSYTTYLEKDSKWHRFMMDNWGGWAVGTSTGPDATNNVVWEMEMNGMMGTSKFRDHEDAPTDPKLVKRGAKHMWGEMTTDGKTWVKVYDTNCMK